MAQRDRSATTSVAKNSDGETWVGTAAALGDVSETLKLQAFGESLVNRAITLAYASTAALLLYYAYSQPWMPQDPIIGTILIVLAYVAAGVLGLTALLRTVVHVRAAMAVVPVGIKALSPKQKKLTGVKYTGAEATPHGSLRRRAGGKATTPTPRAIPKRFPWRHGPDESASARHRRPLHHGATAAPSTLTSPSSSFSTSYLAAKPSAFHANASFTATASMLGTAGTAAAAAAAATTPATHAMRTSPTVPGSGGSWVSPCGGASPLGGGVPVGTARPADSTMFATPRLQAPAVGSRSGFASPQSAAQMSFFSASSGRDMNPSATSGDSFVGATPFRRHSFQPAVKSPERKPEEAVDERVVPARIVLRRICPHRDRWQRSLFLCRQWVDSILKGIWSDICRINDKLQRSPERHRIGVDSLAILQGAVHGDAYGPLQSVLPVLQLDPTNQRYLVARIRDLAQRRQYHTKDGDTVVDLEGKTIPYSRSFPSDAEIVFHCVCCFFDHESTLYHRNPGDIVHPDLRTFTNLHVVKFPERVADLEKRAVKTNVYMYFARPSPPEFKLITRKDRRTSVWELESGHDNLFECIVAFVWYVVQMEGGVVDDHAQMRFAPGGLRVYEIVEPLINP